MGYYLKRLYLKDSVAIWELHSLIHPAAINGGKCHYKCHYYRDVDEFMPAPDYIS